MGGFDLSANYVCVQQKLKSIYEQIIATAITVITKTTKESDGKVQIRSMGTNKFIPCLTFHHQPSSVIIITTIIIIITIIIYLYLCLNTSIYSNKKM